MVITYQNQQWELDGGITARDAVRKLGIDPDTVLVIRNGELVTDDVILADEDRIRLVAVISGG